MDERLSSAVGAEHLPPTRDPGRPGATPASPAGLDDPRALQILNTEHWSLLSARSLVYNEAFARAGMFLTFLSATLVALALVANAMGFSRDFLVLATALLGLDLLIGLATIGRMMDVTLDDLRAIHGMNRIRNAYAQIAPEVLPYLITSIHDDARGVMVTYGEAAASHGWLASFLHGLTTANSLVGIIDDLLAGAVACLLASLAGAPTPVALLVGAATFGLLFAALSQYALRTIRRFEAGLESRFPTPPDG
jgi:hypothetical protein